MKQKKGKKQRETKPLKRHGLQMSQVKNNEWKVAR
jgi:hypothetical protein